MAGEATTFLNELKSLQYMIKVTFIDSLGSDLSVVNAARVSFGKKHEEFDGDKDAGLIKYLASHKHMSPFGHAFASFHVKAPLFVARQLVKHKFLRWNEISRRYVDDAPELYVPDSWRAKADNKKQGSSNETVDLSEYLDSELAIISEDILTAYDTLVNIVKVCPEQARMILPQSMMTEWYWSGSLDAFAGMCNLRLKEDTQYESRLVAQQIDEKMKELFPVSWGELVKKEEENA